MKVLPDPVASASSARFSLIGSSGRCGSPLRRRRRGRGRLVWTAGGRPRAASSTADDLFPTPASSSLTARLFNPRLLPCGGIGADLAVGAAPAGVVGRRRREGARADAGRRGLDGGDRFLEVRLRGRVPAHQVGLEEAELDPLRQGTRHLPPRERVELELEALGRATVGDLLLRDLAGLVVDDRGAQQVLVHAVEAAADPVGPQREAELFLDVRRLLATRLLLVPEARERLAARGLTRLLVLQREEPLVVPLAVVNAEEVVERRVVAGRTAQQVVLDHPVDRGAVHHRVVAQDRHAEDVDVAILQRARLVVVHLLVAQQELLLRRDGREPRLGRLGGRREALDLLDRLRRERARGVFRQIERLEDELAHLPRARAAVVTRARQVELALGPGHADVEEAPLLLLVEVARRERLLDQLDGQLERVPPPAQRELVLDERDQEHHRELEPLRLVDGEDAHGGRLDLRLGDGRVLTRVDQRVEVVDELPHVVVPERLRGVLDATEELRDVLHLGLVPRRGRLRHAREPARVHEELVEQLARRHLPRQLHVPREVGDQAPDRLQPLRGTWSWRGR